MVRKDVTVPMPEELDDRIKRELDYGDSKAEWIRIAIMQRLKEEGADLDDLEGLGDAETDGGQLTLAD